MKLPELAKQLRTLDAKNNDNFTFLTDGYTDGEILEIYNFCTQCRQSLFNETQLFVIVAASTNATEFLALREEYSPIQAHRQRETN